MIKAVLLDLDNTLLHNPDRQFATQFLQLFNEHFQNTLGVTNHSQNFRKAIQILGSIRSTITTNSHTVLENLSVNEPEDSIQDTLDQFYEIIYPQLQPVTTPDPIAPQLVETLLDQNLIVAVATNPIYPISAIHQRLNWAGLDQYINQFAFITSSNNMHFAKPNPAYYVEVVAHLGIEPDEAIVVGDSLKNDISPSSQVRLHTYHISDANPLSQFFEHVQKTDWQLEYFQPSITPEMIIPNYLGNMGALFSILSDVKSHQWTQHAENEWTILQILCHLLTSETTTQRKRLHQILELDNPFIADPLPQHESPDCENTGIQIAQRYLKERLLTINMLENIKIEEWDRPARHNIFGITTLLEMAYFTALHDRLHINQILQTIEYAQ